MDTRDWAVSVPAGYRVGHWEVTHPLGAGSWGGVYAARPGPGAPPGTPPAAVKFLPVRTLTARSIRHLADMADREAAAHSGLDHPRLIRRLAAAVVSDPEDRTLDGALAIVMERAERSLAEALTAGPPPADRAAVVVGICEGLAHMHGRGWIHGDLKPANVLLMADGSVRLADFGLAVELEGTHAYLPPAGSPEYVAPERWAEPLSERGAAVRTSGDVWALGVTVHQVLTGRSPFPGTSGRARSAAAAEYAAGSTELVLAADLPAPWRRFVADCLHRDPSARPDAAALLGRARVAAADGLSPSARKIADGPSGSRRSKGRRRRHMLAGAALTVAGAAAAVAAGLPGGAGDAHAAWFPPGSDVPPRYRDMIVAAAGACTAPGVSPATVAAILKAETGFDPSVADAAKDEYGIARWTPRVLRNYLPGPPAAAPAPPFPPEQSIPAVGRFLCYLSGALADTPGDPGRKLGAAYQSSSGVVREQGLRPPAIGPYVDRLDAALDAYRRAPEVVPAGADELSGCSGLCAVPADAPESLVNAGGACRSVTSGPDGSGERIELPPRTAVRTLAGTAFFHAVGSEGPCAGGDRPPSKLRPSVLQ